MLLLIGGLSNIKTAHTGYGDVASVWRYPNGRDIWVIYLGTVGEGEGWERIIQHGDRCTVRYPLALPGGIKRL